jgi:hypothetical protein
VNRAGTETRLFVCRLSQPYPFASPVFGEEYAAWIISNDSAQTFIERESVATALVSTGCRFAVCSGYECSKWDDPLIALAEDAVRRLLAGEELHSK